jgi:hypothetical protein
MSSTGSPVRWALTSQSRSCTSCFSTGPCRLARAYGRSWKSKPS